MKRGEVWWADLPEPAGSEPGHRRPMLIVQADDFNRSRNRTVLAVSITSNLALARAPGNVPLPRRSAGLERESAVNVSQVVTVDKRFLIERAGQLSGSRLRQVEEGLRLVLALQVLPPLARVPQSFVLDGGTRAGRIVRRLS